jgi:hypothetical protein
VRCAPLPCGLRAFLGGIGQPRPPTYAPFAVLRRPGVAGVTKEARSIDNAATASGASVRGECERLRGLAWCHQQFRVGRRAGVSGTGAVASEIRAKRQSAASRLESAAACFLAGTMTALQAADRWLFLHWLASAPAERPTFRPHVVHRLARCPKAKRMCSHSVRVRLPPDARTVHQEEAPWALERSLAYIQARGPIPRRRVGWTDDGMSARPHHQPEASPKAAARSG